MKAKEKAIREAYGEYWESVKDFVIENGWCTVRKHILFDKIIKDIEIEIQGYQWRPKSLQEIENNNGWIKIESEDDLPKTGEYDMSSFKLLYWTNNGLYHAEDYKRWKLHYDHLEITHYQLQPIVKTQPPLY